MTRPLPFFDARSCSSSDFPISPVGSASIGQVRLAISPGRRPALTDSRASTRLQTGYLVWRGRPAGLQHDRRQDFGALASFSGPSSNCCAGDAWGQGSDRGCTRRGPKRLTLRVLRGLRNADEEHLLPITEAALQPSAVAAADFCAVALRFPHRVEFRCAGSHYKSKVVW
jgi:hypothetical protein